jgi:hypothetical protein
LVGFGDHEAFSVTGRREKATARALPPRASVTRMLALAAITFSLSGCGSSDQPESPEDSPQSPEEAPRISAEDARSLGHRAGLVWITDHPGALVDEFHLYCAQAGQAFGAEHDDETLGLQFDSGCLSADD